MGYKTFYIFGERVTLLWDDGVISFMDLDVEAEKIAHIISQPPIPPYLHILAQLEKDLAGKSERDVEIMLRKFGDIESEFNNLLLHTYTASKDRIERICQRAYRKYSQEDIPLSLALNLAWRYGGRFLLDRTDTNKTLLYMLLETSLRGWGNDDLKIKLAHDRDIPQRVMQDFLEKGSLNLYIALASNPKTPRQVLTRFLIDAFSGFEGVQKLRMEALKSWRWPLDTSVDSRWAHILLWEGDEATKRILATKILLPCEQLALANGRSIKVKSTLARNPHLCDEAKIKLSKSKSLLVQRALLRQETLPLEALDNLAPLRQRLERSHQRKHGLEL